jgi:hypothetical protein
LIYPCSDYGYNQLLIYGWDPSYCNSSYTHLRSLSLNNYLYPQSTSPPSGSYNLLCSNNYSVSISNKIKITIPDDPIFGGTYVFDYSPTNAGDHDLFSTNWILNSGESSHSLVPYNHPDSAANGKLLVSLTDNGMQGLVFGYPGYMEIKTSYYKDEINTGARQLEDVFAFPAQFIFTAVQPPCPCSGIPGVDLVSTVGSGHRVTVALAAPIRWRHPYRNWILVDKVSHTIDDSTISYASGSVFNDGASYFSTTDNSSVYLPNSKYIKLTKTYVPGTANSVIGDGYIGLSNEYYGLTSIVCTGISDLGVAFRSSASGLGIDRANTYYFDNTFNIQGIGGFQEFSRDVANNWDLIIKDERPFFDKIPIRANIDFIYSCRSGIGCLNMNGSTISSVSGSGISCSPFSSYINIDYLCGNDEQAYPQDSYWINNGITSTQIVFSGSSGINPTIMQTYGYNNDSIFTYDAYVSYDNNPIINIPYTGYLPSQIREFLISKFRAVSFSKNINNTYAINSINNIYSNLDLYWNVDLLNHTSKVYVTADEANLSYPTVIVSGAGNSEFNGTYYINKTYGIFNSYESYFYTPQSLTRIVYANSGYYMQKYSQNKWISYYSSSGVANIVGSPIYHNKVIRSNWSTGICLSGISPTPISIGYY